MLFAVKLKVEVFWNYVLYSTVCEYHAIILKMPIFIIDVLKWMMIKKRKSPTAVHEVFVLKKLQ